MKWEIDVATHERKIEIENGITVAIALSIGLFIYFGLNLTRQYNHGYWIAYTTVIVLSTPTNQGAILQRASHRVIGTFLGLFLGYLFIEAFMRIDYRWSYLVVLIFFICMYAYYVTETYFLYTMFYTVFIPILELITHTDQNNFFNTTELYSERFIYTVAGAFIAVVCVCFINLRTAKSLKFLKKHTTLYFRSYSSTIKICAECFSGKIEFDDEFRRTVRKLVDSLSAMDPLYQNMRYELGNDIAKKHSVETIFIFTSHLTDCISRLITVAENDKIDLSAITMEKFDEILKEAVHKTENIISYVYGKKDSLTENISLIKLQLQGSSFINPTLIFVKTLEEISRRIDEFSHNTNSVSDIL